MANAVINSIIFRSWIPNLSGDIISVQPFKKLQNGEELNNIGKFEDQINTKSPYYRTVKQYNGVNEKYHYIRQIDPNDNHSGPVLLCVILFDNGILRPSKILLFLYSKNKYEFLSEISIQDFEQKGLVTLKPINYAAVIDGNTNNTEVITANIQSHLTIAYTALREFYHKHTHHYGEYRLKNDADYLTGSSFNPSRIEAIKEIVIHFKKQIDIHHEELGLFDLCAIDDNYDILKNFRTSLKARRTATGCFLYAKNLLLFYQDELSNPQDQKFVQYNLEIFDQALFSIRTMGEYIHDLHTGYLSETSEKMNKSISKFSGRLVVLTWGLIFLTAFLTFFSILTVLREFKVI
jgi:hypothetical protein